METVHRILIVDDEEAILFSFEKLLRGPLVEVDVCMELEEAFERLASNHYDAVITDYRLSHSESNEGMILLRHIKNNKPTLPVIFLTGYGSDEIKGEVLALGAFAYFDKPIKMTDLYRTLQETGIPLDNM